MKPYEITGWLSSRNFSASSLRLPTSPKLAARSGASYFKYYLRYVFVGAPTRLRILVSELALAPQARQLKISSEGHSEKMGLLFRGWQGGRRWHLARSPWRQRRGARRNDQDR